MLLRGAFSLILSFTAGAGLHAAGAGLASARRPPQKSVPQTPQKWKGKAEMDRILLTPNGERLLREELKRLKEEERPRVVKAIAEAREHGDLRENAEYHAAKHQQGMLEARVREIEGKLSLREVVDVAQLKDKAGGRVVFGATVTLHDEADDNEVAYRIVGEDEAGADAAAISFASPLARALIGKKAGDTAVVDAPAGDRNYKILAVAYA